MRIKLKEGLSRNVIILGIVSGLTDISSEMLYPVIPIFLTTILNAPMSIVGIIEGIAEATASILKIAGGYFSDKTKKRKIFIVSGYSLSALSKPLMAFATTWYFILFARFIDRVGKGIRTSPRDALIASSTQKEYLGKAFGFHRAMDTLGAAIGPLITLFFLWFLGEKPTTYREIFIIAFIPALIGVIILIKYISDVTVLNDKIVDKENLNDSNKFTTDFKIFLLISVFFYLAKFSDAFFIIKIKEVGFSTFQIIWVYFFYNILYTLLSTPFGIVADKIGKTRTFTLSFLVYSAVCFGFSMATESYQIWLIFSLYSLYGALNEGIAKAIISELTHQSNRATAFGIYQGFTGIALLFSSSIAGILWDNFTPQTPFYFSAILAMLSGIFISIWSNIRRIKT
ncbi:MAG: MFS transporter [Elusimicrobiales bacterium]|nr:MFS transporter [Elusimicrobiales bacterium]